MVPDQATNPHFNKIGILRSGALGDMLVALPAIYTLRKHFPEAELVLLTDPQAASFTIEGRFPINRTVLLPSIKGISPNGEKHWSAYPQHIQHMQQEQFDAFINFQGKGMAANPYIEAFAPKSMYSFKTDQTQRSHTTRYSYYQSEVVRLWEIIKLMGIDYLYPEAQYMPTKNDHANITSFLNGTDAFVVIGPFSSDNRRNWISENYIPVIEHIRQLGFEVILAGTKEQSKRLEDINQKTAYACTLVAGCLAIPALAALLSRAALIIAPDNGLLHLARAVNTPTIGLYWAPNLINWGPPTRNQNAVLISWTLHCPICNTMPITPYPFLPQDQCTHNVSFMQSISPEQVIEQVNMMIQTSTNKTAYE